MKAHTVSLINAFTLILCAIWGFWAIDFNSLTALIPALFGLALLGCYSGVKVENKIVAHVAVLLTMVALIVLCMPLSSALGSGDQMQILRTVLMVASCVWAMIFFIKSFRDARRERTEG